MNPAILEEIRTEFFKLAESNREGYHISLIKAYDWLELDLTEDIKQKLLKRYLRNEDYAFIEAKSEDDTNAHFIIRKDGKKHIPWFSDDGFKMLCFVCKSVKSKYIIAHFMQCEKDYLRAVKQTEKENAEELQILREKINGFDSKLMKIANERDDLLVRNHSYREANTRLRAIELHTSTKEAFAIDGTPEHKHYCLLVNMFFHKTPVYIVNADYVNAKYMIKPKRRRSEKKSRENSHEDLVSPDEKEEPEDLADVVEQYDLLEYEIPYNEIFPGDLEHYSGLEFYIHLPSFKSKAEKKPEIYQYVGDIQVLNKEHLNSVKAYLSVEDVYVTKMKHVYRISYEALISTINDHISEKLFNTTR